MHDSSEIKIQKVHRGHVCRRHVITKLVLVRDNNDVKDSVNSSNSSLVSMGLSLFVKPWVSIHHVIENTQNNQNWDATSDVSLSRMRNACVETLNIDSRVCMSVKLVWMTMLLFSLCAKMMMTLMLVMMVMMGTMVV